MFKQAKKTLDNLSHLETANYIKMAKKIRDNHDNPSKKLVSSLKCVSRDDPKFTKDLYCILTLNRLF